MKRIEMADLQLAQRCVEAFYEQCPKVLPGVPAEMHGGQWQRGD